jgi:predicted transcriptional regulator
MRQENVYYFTDTEKEFIRLLVEIGIQRTVAIVLVFLINVPEATSREIERGSDLRQPEVSNAIRYMTGQGWIKQQVLPPGKKGRPIKKYSLGITAKEIMATLEQAKKDEVKNQLDRIRKMKDYLT